MFGFDKMFDFSRDGKLDSWERAAQFQFLDDMSDEENDDSDEEDEDGNYDEDDECDGYDDEYEDDEYDF